MLILASISSVLPFLTKCMHQKPKTHSLSRDKTHISGYFHDGSGYHAPCAKYRRVNMVRSHLGSSGGKSSAGLELGTLSCFVSGSRSQSQTSGTSGTPQRFRSQGDKFRDVIHFFLGQSVIAHILFGMHASS